jgi:O-antigen/teichoic acid export membrane protein
MAILSTFMSLADAGLTSTFSREVARTEDKVYIRNLLFTVERIYIGICIAVSLIVFLFSGPIARNFLKAERLLPADLSNYVIMMGIGAALQMITSMYNGGLMGLQKQVLTNGISIVYNIFRSVVGILIIIIIPSLYAYFFWYILTSIVYLFVSRYFLWKKIKLENRLIFDFSLIKNIWRFAAGMMLMTLISVTNTQIDKLVVGKLLLLTEFAYYSLASFIAQIPLMLTMPVVIAVLPQLTKLVTLDKTDDLKRIYHNYSFIISTIAGIVGAVFFVYTNEIVLLWIGSAEITNNVSLVAKILLIGGVFLSFQLMPFYLSIANGHNKTNVKLGLLSLIFVIPAITFFISKLGINGAGIPWSILNFVSFIYLGIRLNNRFLKGDTWLWFIYDVSLPLVVSFSICFLLKYIFIDLHSLPGLISKVVLSCLLSLVLSIAFYNRVFPTYKINLVEYLKFRRVK